MQFIDDCFLDGRNPIQETFILDFIFSWMVFLFPCWQLFPTLHNCFWWSIIAFLLFCLTALTAFEFCLYFLPHFTHLLNDLHSSLTGTLSINKWPDTAISICNFSILDYPALFICSPTILYHGLPSAMPSACLILPCLIYACNIISRFILFSTSATYLHLSYATKLDC